MQRREKSLKGKELDIVMTGFAGLYGSVILAREKYGELRGRYPVSFLEEATKQERLIWQIPEAAPAGKHCGDVPSLRRRCFRGALEYGKVRGHRTGGFFKKDTGKAGDNRDL